VPAAITGTDHLFLGPLPKPKRVQVAFSEPVPVHHRQPTREEAGEVVDELVWPAVQEEFGRLRARPGLIAAGLALLGLGIGGGVAAKRSRAKPARRLRLPRRKPRSRLPWR
jgi:1-acyl-sn-glycerol-3-phosphate acyltransferase